MFPSDFHSIKVVLKFPLQNEKFSQNDSRIFDPFLYKCEHKGIIAKYGPK
jgi:hypothetical protein